MEKMTIADFLISHKINNPVSFHMPGHKGNDHIRKYGYGEFLDNILKCDITEIEGADNLFQPEGIIKNTMESYKSLYGVKETKLLINGSSCGLIASILATVKRGEKMIVARNCHKSIFNGVLLGGVKPIYAKPEFIKEYGISGEISVYAIKKLITMNPEAKAVILPSPNYYGVCSDIKEIARLAHENNMLLIVDQAHGAHLKFYNEAKAAETQGADIVINSTHKTLFSFTESAILNICSDKVDIFELEDKLQAIESTSPSYLLMGSLDINGKILEKNAEELISEWKSNIEYFLKEADGIEGLRIMKHPMLDETKINLDMSPCGLDGPQLEKRLMEKGIYPELVSGNIVMCMTGIGNIRGDYTRLLNALKEFSDSAERRDLANPPGECDFNLILKEIPKAKKRIKVSEGEGEIVAESIIPYPPGIPIACPGEILTAEVIEYIKGLRGKGYKVIGIDVNEKIAVGK